MIEPESEELKLTRQDGLQGAEIWRADATSLADPSVSCEAPDQ